MDASAQIRRPLGPTPASWPWLAGAVVLAGLAAVTVGLRCRVFDYDEVSHAHMIWQVAHGVLPYRDFVVNHFPFFWMLLAPISRWLPERPALLAAYSVVALLFNALLVAGLMLHVRRSVGGAGGRSVLLAFAPVLVSPAVLPFLLEFRPDSFANALFFAALLGLRAPGPVPRRVLAGCGFGLTLALLIIPKNVLLLPLLALTEGVGARRPWRAWYRVVAWSGAGVLAALAAGALALSAYQIPIGDVYQMAVRYHLAAGPSHVAGPPLWQAITSYPSLAVYTLAGLLAWAGLVLCGKARVSPYLAALLVFLAVELVFTRKPYLQYSASWFLLATSFAAASAAALRLETRRAARNGLLASALALAVFSLRDLALEQRVRRLQLEVMSYILRQVPAGDYVQVDDLWFHPVFRRDTFWRTGMDIDGAGDAYARVAARLRHFPRHGQFSAVEMRQDLDRHPPALVFLGMEPRAGKLPNLPLSVDKARVLNDYLDHHRADYAVSLIPHTEFYVALKRCSPGGLPR